MTQPLLSIVTIHFREPASLQATLDSLPARVRGDSLEWIVVDGGSDLEAPADREVFDAVRARADQFISEPDHGIYDAMNKGSGRARGAYVLFLNAGDLLHPSFEPGNLPAAGPQGPAMLWGISYDRAEDGEAYPVRTRAPAWLRYGPTTAHQAILFRREALGSQPYDTRYRIAADYDLICRLYRAGSGVRRLEMPVCIYGLGGRSAHDPEATLREEAAIRARHFGLPGWVNGVIFQIKLRTWQTTQRLPGLRKWLRGRV